jgi:hypothetical protein
VCLIRQVQIRCSSSVHPLAESSCATYGTGYRTCGVTVHLVREQSSVFTPMPFLRMTTFSDCGIIDSFDQNRIDHPDVNDSVLASFLVCGIVTRNACSSDIHWLHARCHFRRLQTLGSCTVRELIIQCSKSVREWIGDVEGYGITFLSDNGDGTWYKQRQRSGWFFRQESHISWAYIRSWLGPLAYVDLRLLIWDRHIGQIHVC